MRYLIGICIFFAGWIFSIKSVYSADSTIISPPPVQPATKIIILGQGETQNFPMAGVPNMYGDRPIDTGISSTKKCPPNYTMYAEVLPRGQPNGDHTAHNNTLNPITDSRFQVDRTDQFSYVGDTNHTGININNLQHYQIWMLFSYYQALNRYSLQYTDYQVDNYTNANLSWVIYCIPPP